MLVLRLAFTLVSVAVMIGLLRAGNPLGGLVIVPLLAVSLRRAAEDGRLNQFTSRFR
jgi:hypothetical protein